MLGKPNIYPKFIFLFHWTCVNLQIFGYLVFDVDIISQRCVLILSTSLNENHKLVIWGFKKSRFSPEISKV